jgi:polysaccharide pyruvyl transferase WcaK-like protein
MPDKKYDLAIVGCWSVDNYGAHLTYYALYQTIRDMGLKPLMVERPGNAPRKPFKTPPYFRNNPYMPMDLAPIYATREEMKVINKQTDVFLIGSDQLFNPPVYHDMGEFVALDWVDDNKKKAAYSASFANDYINDTDEALQFLSYNLKRFDYFSVREDSAVKLLYDTFGIKADFVIDPVFLCNIDYYKKIAERGKSLTNNKKIFAYILDVDAEKEAMLSCLEKETGFESNRFTALSRPVYSPAWRNIVADDFYVEDWTRALIESDIVISDSFHCICFSILFKKPFIIIKNKRRGIVRIESLSRLFNFNDRTANDISELGNILPTIKNINFDEMHGILKNERVRCMSLLKDAIVPGNIK